MSTRFISKVSILTQMGPWEIVSRQLMTPLMPVYPLPLWESRPYSGYGREFDDDTFYHPVLETFLSLFLYDKAPEMATYAYFVISDEALHNLEFLPGDLPISNYHYFPEFRLDLFFELEVQPSTPEPTVQPIVLPPTPIPTMLSPIIRPISPIPHPDNPVTRQLTFDLVTDYILLGIF